MVFLKNMYFSSILTIKKLFAKDKPQTKEPRKKVQIRLRKFQKYLDNQIRVLKINLAKNELSDLTKSVGKDLLNDAIEFQNNNYMKNSKDRINNLKILLLDNDDYSIWVNNQAKLLGDIINCFNTTIE